MAVSTKPPPPRVAAARAVRLPTASVSWGLGLSAIVALVTFYVAYDGGTYTLTSRNAFAIAVWWTLLVTVVLAPRLLVPVPRAALVSGGFLLAFALFTLASVAWAESTQRAFNEFNRVLLYFGLYVLVVIVAHRLRELGRWSDGVAVGLAAVALLALASRLFPQALPEGDVPRFLPEAARRLSYPVNYWNALGVLAALTVPLLLAASLRARHAATRGLALGTVPALSAVIYLTSSRGGAATLFIGVGVFFALTARRWAAASAVGLGALGTVAAVAILRARPQLVDGPLDSALAQTQGRSAALLLALVCLATGLAFAIGSSVAPPAPKLGTRSRAAVVAAIVLILVAGIAALDPVHRFEQFKAIPTTNEASVGGHLLSGSGNGRWQLWTAAVDAFETEPIHGRGAGSFETWWGQHRTIQSFVLDAHSLYLETLGELGVVGLALLLGCFGSGLVAAAAGVRRLRGDDRITLAALAACFTAFAFEAGFDWMWEVTAVSAVGIAFLALLTGATAPQRRERMLPSRHRLTVRGVATLVCLLAIASQAVPLVSALKIDDSEAAVSRGDLRRAAADADLARAIEPWASTPYLQLALVEEQGGDLRAARLWLREAIARDRLDWRLWYVSSRLEYKSGRYERARASLERARQLNRDSPILNPPSA